MRRLAFSLVLTGLLIGCSGGPVSSRAVAGAGSSPAPPVAPSPTATPSPNPAPAAAASPAADVLTYRNDSGRTGQNLNESRLTLANVNASSFGLVRILSVDGKVDAQPLYLSQLGVNGAPHNVLLVATEHASVVAFDADAGGVLWRVSLLAAGETPSDSRGCSQIQPEIGVTATPVVDRHAGPHGALYLIAMSRDSSGTFHQRLHALDLATGAELFAGPAEVSASYPSSGGGSMSFDPAQYAERAALVLASGTLYTTWTSHCDFRPYSGWIIAYDQQTLARKAVLNVGPNGNGNGPSIWMSGDGPAADAAGNLYLLTANGAFERDLDAHGFPAQQDYGNSFLKLTASGATLAVSDYFALKNGPEESTADMDLGSGGELLLPDLSDASGATRHLMVGAGKDGNIYLVDRDQMGKFDPATNHIWQEIDGALPGGVWGTPAYFDGRLYYGDVGGTIKAFSISAAKLSSSPTSQTQLQFPFPGVSPAISANGTQNAILWAHENGDPAVLHAYDATNLTHELYNSSQRAGGADQFGAGNKFITPTVAGGKVFVGTQSGVAVFGLR